VKPRVVFVNHCARLSGGELALVRLLGALGDAIDAHVILGEHGPLVPRLESVAASTEVLPLAPSARDTRRGRVVFSRPPLRETASSTAYVLRLARQLRRMRPDLVHANSLKALVYGGLAGRLAGRPVVWHVRDRIAADYLPRAAVRFVGLLARSVPHGVIANSRETLLRLDSASGGRILRKPHAVVYDPVDQMRAAQRQPDGRPLRVGMVGRIAPWKGQHIFLEAFAAAFEGGDERAVVTGAPLFGEEAYERELHRRAGELGIADRVEFAGFREDVGAELARIDVLVHASLLAEPLGQVVIEGMQAHLPVVAAGAGGPTEVVEDGVTGLLYPPGDAAALADQLQVLARDAALRLRIGAAARERSRAFAPERVAPLVLDLYQEVLAD
jgi:glycosyltransferase involved in cell wall biosynthesis